MGFGGSGGSGGGSIASAADVAVSNPVNNQALTYNSTVQKWQNSTISGSGIESVNTVASSGASVTLPDITIASLHTVTLTANCTFIFPTATAGKSFSVRLVHGSSGFTVTWPSSVVWQNGVAPTLSMTPGTKDLVTFTCFANGEWMGFVAGLGF